MDFTNLDELMKNRKKETARKDKKNEYALSMKQLFLNESYSVSYEKYFFEGFSYLGSTILYESLGKVSEEERQELLKIVKEGELFKANDKGITFKVLLSMLAQGINRFPTEYHFFNEIIKILPDYSKSKENKLFGLGPKFVQKYFIQELHKNAQLPSFLKLEIKDVFIKEFRNVMIELLHLSEVKDEVQEKKTQHVLLWLGIQPKIIEVKKKPALEKKEIEAIQTQNIEKIEKNKNSTDKVFGELLSNQKKIEKSISQLSDVYLDYKKVVEIKESLDRKLSILSRENEELMNSNLQLNILVEDARSEIEKNLKLIGELEEQLGRHKDVVSVYAYDKEKSKNELLNNFGAKLQPEFNEYKDALLMDMSIALGENLRDQLGMVFKILSKNGITFEER